MTPTIAVSIAAVLVSVVAGITGGYVSSKSETTEQLKACITSGGTWDDTHVGGILCEVTR